MNVQIIVVHMTENSDLYHETFESEQAAEAFMSDMEDKALLIRIEMPLMCSTDVKITVEDRT